MIDFIRNPVSRLHTPLESWVLLLILSVYPCVTSLHAYQPTLCTINFVVKVGLEPNTVQDGLDNLITSRVQMVMDRGVFRTWVPSRITSTWLFTPLHQVNGLTAIWEWGFPVISGLRGTGRNWTADTLSFNQVLYLLSYRSLFFPVSLLVMDFSMTIRTNWYTFFQFFF